MSSLQEATCPYDHSCLHEDLADLPLDDGQDWTGTLAGPFMTCPTCLRRYATDDPRIWVPLTHPSEL